MSKYTQNPVKFFEKVSFLENYRLYDKWYETKERILYSGFYPLGPNLWHPYISCVLFITNVILRLQLFLLRADSGICKFFLQ